MLRFTFFGPFVVGCAAVAFSGVLPQSAHGQGADYGSGMLGSGYDGEMGGYVGAMSGRAETEEQRFQRGIRRVVKSLEQAETEEEKERLLELGRKGLEWRYQSKLDVRKQELKRLRQRLEQLENDYARRAQAMPRVINLQLESLKLASEGLINLEDVIGRQTSMEMGGYGGSGYGGEMGYSGGYGGGYEGGGYPGQSVPPDSQPIKPEEDPFEGLGDEEKKTPDESGGADRQGRTPRRPGTIAEPPSTSTPDDDPFGAPSPDEEDPFDAGPPSDPSESETDDPFSF